MRIMYGHIPGRKLHVVMRMTLIIHADLLASFIVDAGECSNRHLALVKRNREKVAFDVAFVAIVLDGVNPVENKTVWRGGAVKKVEKEKE